jgi:hypothetical protein
MGRNGRLRVGPRPKLHNIRRRRRELYLLIRLKNADATFIRAASGFRSDSAFRYTSQRP